MKFNIQVLAESTAEIKSTIISSGIQIVFEVFKLNFKK